jgi:hypothetical protein
VARFASQSRTSRRCGSRWVRSHTKPCTLALTGAPAPMRVRRRSVKQVAVRVPVRRGGPVARAAHPAGHRQLLRHGDGPPGRRAGEPTSVASTRGTRVPAAGRAACLGCDSSRHSIHNLGGPRLSVRWS